MKHDLVIMSLAAIAVVVGLPLLADVIASKQLAAERGPFDCGSGYLVSGCWGVRK